MTYSILHWVVSSAVFGPLVIGLPVLALLIAFDEVVLRTQSFWRAK